MFNDAVPALTDETISLFADQRFGPAIESMFKRIHDDVMIGAIVFFIFSVIILSWPPKRRRFNPGRVLMNPLNQPVNGNGYVRSEDHQSPPSVQDQGV